jgi:hypothetical protein
MTSWHQAKLLVEHALDISHDALHVLVGILAWLLVALIVRRPISSWVPWLCLAGLTALNEIFDVWTEQWPDPGMQIGEGAKDLGLTMLMPSLLLLAARHRPDLFRPSPGRKK